MSYETQAHSFSPAVIKTAEGRVDSDFRQTQNASGIGKSDDVPCLSAVFLFPGRMGTDDGGNAPGCAGTDGNAEGRFGRGGGIGNTGFYFGKK
mgnify:CR=1 FL=1